MRLHVRYTANTLALILIGAAYVLGQAWLDRPVPPRPSLPIGGRSGPPVPPPTARDVLERADTLRLTAEQRARLVALDRNWGEEAGALDRAVAAAGAEFDRFAHDLGPRTVAEIQRRSAEYRELSAALRVARKRHAEAARAVLTDAQRQSVARRSSTDRQRGEP